MTKTKRRIEGSVKYVKKTNCSPHAHVRSANCSQNGHTAIDGSNNPIQKILLVSSFETKFKRRQSKKREKELINNVSRRGYKFIKFIGKKHSCF